MSSKKISPRRLSDLTGPRRKKPPVRTQAQWLAEAMKREHEVVQTLVNDKVSREDHLQRLGLPVDPMLVWTDFDRTHEFTSTNSNHLPAWKDLTEYMKLQIGFMVALGLGGYSFSSDIHPAHLAKWVARGSVTTQILKRLKEEAAKQGLNALSFAYLIETRSRSGKSRSKIHLHGYVVPNTSLDITRFKVATEKAFHHARGAKPLKSDAWDEKPAYDVDTGDGRGWGRWVSYLAKNVRRYDARIKGRRVYISRAMNQAAQEFWSLLREEPLP